MIYSVSFSGGRDMYYLSRLVSKTTAQQRWSILAGVVTIIAYACYRWNRTPAITTAAHVGKGAKVNKDFQTKQGVHYVFEQLKPADALIATQLIASTVSLHQFQSPEKAFAFHGSRRW